MPRIGPHRAPARSPPLPTTTDLPLQAPYTILATPTDQRTRAAAAVAEVNAVLSIPEGDALRVLRHFKW